MPISIYEEDSHLLSVDIVSKRPSRGSPQIGRVAIWPSLSRRMINLRAPTLNLSCPGTIKDTGYGSVPHLEESCV